MENPVRSFLKIAKKGLTETYLCKIFGFVCLTIWVTEGCYPSWLQLRIMKKMGKLVQFDDALDALADVQRRELLLSLLEHNPQDDSPVVIGDSESEVEALENLTEMNHVHLPKLVEYGFIEWDKENNEVMKGPEFAEIRPLLELLDDHSNELPDGWL